VEWQRSGEFLAYLQKITPKDEFLKVFKGLSPKGDLGKKPTTANQTMAIYR